jgi:2-polyprenyl-6-methoxyphenol hydroxylase-like FAD-dependent oxidoreductase
MAAEEVAVLVVGAGPAGLATALELAGHDVPVMLVERRAGLSPLPRATAVSTRTMELIRAWGLEEQVRAGAIDVSWDGWISETLAVAAAGQRFPIGYPTPAQAAVLSPTFPACVPQDHLEPVLLAELHARPDAAVRFGTELLQLRPDADGATALVRDTATGAATTVRARYLVGADGAHSAVRTQLGIALRGPDRLVEHLAVLFRAPELWPLLGECRHGIYVVTEPTAAGVFVPAGRDNRWLYGREWEPGRQRLTDYPEDRLTALIRAGAGTARVHPRIERLGSFSFAAQIVDTYRAGPVFLAGDAAHRVTPRGGTGLNTAIQDGHDVGWKLAWVLRGWAGAELLDTYEAERRPVGLHNTVRSADPTGSVRTLGQALPADLGGRIPHLETPAGVSTLDLLGPGLTLFIGPASSAWRAAAARVRSAAPLHVHELDALTAAALGVPGDGALLARPDGHPVAAWPASADPDITLRSGVQLLGQTRSTAGRAA